MYILKIPIQLPRQRKVFQQIQNKYTLVMVKTKKSLIGEAEATAARRICLGNSEPGCGLFPARRCSEGDQHDEYSSQQHLGSD